VEAQFLLEPYDIEYTPSKNAINQLGKKYRIANPADGMLLECVYKSVLRDSRAFIVKMFREHIRTGLFDD